MIRTVIFDIDGTLYNYGSAHKDGLAAVSEYLRKKEGWSNEQFSQAYQTAFDALNRQAKGTAASHNRLIRFSMLASENGLRESDALAMDELYWEEFMRNISPFPFLREAMDDLKEAGLKIGAGTNMTAYVQYLKLRKLGLLDYFDFVLTSEEALEEKPREGFFRRCCERAECLPHECLFIGDEMEKDVIGALRSGMHALLYSPDGTGTGDSSLLLRSYGDLAEKIRITA